MIFLFPRWDMLVPWRVYFGWTCANRELLSSDSLGFGRRVSNASIERQWFKGHIHACVYYTFNQRQVSAVQFTSHQFISESLFIHSDKCWAFWHTCRSGPFPNHNFWHPCWISSAHIIDESPTFYILFGTRRNMYDKNGKDFFTKHTISLKVQKPTSHRKVYISDDFFATGSWVRAVRWVYFLLDEEWYPAKIRWDLRILSKLRSSY